MVDRLVKPRYCDRPHTAVYSFSVLNGGPFGETTQVTLIAGSCRCFSVLNGGPFGETTDGKSPDEAFMFQCPQWWTVW